MEYLKNWAVYVAVVCAVCAVTGVLTPQGGIQRSVKFVVSVFTVIAFVLPLKSIEFSVPEYTSGIDGYIESYELADEVQEQVKNSLKTQIEGEIAAFLNTNGIENYKIQTVVNIDALNNISIDRIKILLPVEYITLKGIIKDYIISKFTVEPEISITEINDEKESE